MNTFLKKSWIALLAVATTIVGACSSSRNTNKAENNGNKNHDGELTNNDKNIHSVDNDTLGVTRTAMKAKIDELRTVIKEREMSCIYGSPEVMQRYGAETERMRREADSLQQVYDNNYISDASQEKQTLEKRLEEIQNVIRRREGALIYGSPEVMNEYRNETKKLKDERDSLMRRLDEINDTTNE